MKRIMIDADNCVGCKNCSIACMNSHRKGESGNFYDLDLNNPANESRNLILLDAKSNYRPLFCRHCEKPACASACMSGALTKDADGIVQYNAEQCGLCYMCVMSCPFGVLKPDHAKTAVLKCNFCSHNGGNPACVENCLAKTIYVKELLS